jgi:hypothetical protein
MSVFLKRKTKLLVILSHLGRVKFCSVSHLLFLQCCISGSIKIMCGQAWWHTFVIPALMRLRKEDLKCEASLGYTGRPYPKKKRKKNST